MNKLIVGFVFGCIMGSLAVGMNVAAASETEKVCAEMRELSHSIMAARQSGLSVVEAVAIANSSEHKELGRVVKKIVLEAYEKPRFSTTKFQRNAANNFADTFYIGCMRAGNK